MNVGTQAITANGHQYTEPLVMLWFSAEWCGPCKQIAPVINMIEQGYAGTVRVVKVDAEEDFELAHRLGVRAVPTLILLDHEKRLDTKVGSGSYAELTQWIDSHINLVA
tara:strand:- start:245 stop:571 length:327 start_codon:yes stop_codon:yes gene_type:complete